MENKKLMKSKNSNSKRLKTVKT